MESLLLMELRPAAGQDGFRQRAGLPQGPREDKRVVAPNLPGQPGHRAQKGGVSSVSSEESEPSVLGTIRNKLKLHNFQEIFCEWGRHKGKMTFCK